jgi:ribosomal protein S18 acetylase RimI-like enzyme
MSTAAHGTVSTSHIRRLDVSRDLTAVADLLEEAFRAEMDQAGARAIRDMRLMGFWGGFPLWLDNWLFPNTSAETGYVWVQAGQVVGHLSLRRASGYGERWLIGNVAVHRDYRNQGIARGLMHRALEHIHQHDGRQVNLLVRANNSPAVRLYTNLGFRQTYALAQWQRPPRRRAVNVFCAPPAMPEGIRLRRAQSGDQEKLYNLACASRPDNVAWVDSIRRADFYTGWDRRLGNWLEGRRQVCLVAEADKLVGAAWAEAPRPPDEGRVRIWVTPEYKARLEMALVSAAMQALSTPVTTLLCDFAADHTPLYVNLAQFGFLPARILAHLQLTL